MSSCGKKEQQALEAAWALLNSFRDAAQRDYAVAYLLIFYARALCERHSEAAPADIVANTAAFERLLRARLREIAEPPGSVH